jgi:hypothetical protein
MKENSVPKMKKHLETALINGKFLVNLINDILDFSQI